MVLGYVIDVKRTKNVAVPFTRDNLPGLRGNIASNAISKFEEKISGKGASRAGKGSTLLISNEDMNDTIKIINSLEDSGVLIDGVTETIKLEIIQQEGQFLGAVSALSATSLVQNFCKRGLKIRKGI